MVLCTKGRLGRQVASESQFHRVDSFPFLHRVDRSVQSKPCRRLCCAAELVQLLRLFMASFDSWEVACLGRSFGCADVEIESWLLSEFFYSVLVHKHMCAVH